MSVVAAESPTKSICTRIDADVLRRIKVAAILRDTSMEKVIGEALSEWLSRNDRVSKEVAKS